MATPEEVRLGRLAVKEGHATEEQVLDALRVRNKNGGDLGELLVQRGLLSKDTLAKLRVAAKTGDGAPVRDRAEASTDAAISITSTREILARDQLQEALRAATKDPKGALKELRRLAKEFADTESGVRAEKEARGISSKQDLS